MVKKLASGRKFKGLLKKAVKWALIAMGMTMRFMSPQTQMLAVIASFAVFSFIMGLSTNVLQKSNIGLSFTKVLVMLLMYWYGIKIAMVAGPILQMFEWVGQNYYKPSMVFILPNTFLMPLYGFWILDYSIAWAGFFVLVVANIIEIIGSLFIAKDPVKIYMYYITNTLFNFPIYWRIAPLLVG